MQAKTLLICRASEKVYEKLSVSNVPADCIIEPRPGALARGAVPCELFPFGEASDTYVAVYPDSTVKSATYELVALAQDGRIVESTERTVDFAAAKWASRANYRLHRSDCDEIRCMDERRGLAATTLSVTEVIPDNDWAIVRGMFRTPLSQEHFIRFTCLDANLVPMDVNFISMGQTTEESAVSKRIQYWTHAFSVRVRRGHEAIVFRAWDEKNPRSHAFSVLTPSRREELLSQTANLFMSAGIDPYYSEWLENHRSTHAELKLQSRCTLPETPRFCIVVPLFRTPTEYFSAMLDSVRSQSYANWELLLVNASPNDDALCSAIESACARDPRVIEVRLERNLGISGNTNEGIRRANGDFVCFLDHDDFIEPDTLFAYAEAVCDTPETDLIYCDEDILDADGRFKAPFFKPDFDLDLLRTKNYITHFLAIRKSVLDQLELPTSELDGAQDYHLTLQAVEHARAVTHLPRVLYHWRVCPTSSAKNAEEKPYAIEAGLRALRAHLARTEEHARAVEGDYPFTYRTLYDAPEPHPLVSVIVPTCDHVDVLRACIESVLEKTTYDNYEIVLVENNSTESRTFEYYSELLAEHADRVRVERWQGEFNFSKIVNYGVSRAGGEYLLLLNNDTELLTPGWMEQFVGICARGDVGAAGALLYYPDDTIQHAGVVCTGIANHLFRDMPRGNDGYFHLATCQRQLSAVTAACMMVKREAFEAVGGFEESLSVCYNDVDFCLKLREYGYLIVYTPEVEMYHHESLSRGLDERGEKRERQIGEQASLRNRWYRFYAKGDPYFSKNVRQEFPLSSWYHF